MAAITAEVYSSMGLNEGEYRRIVELLEREPTHTELGMFAVMWSEHCGYKYSRPVLALFKRYKEAMEGAGLENAGVVELGDGLGITMKVESHNHPSAVEPYEGAATGVGGIIRDILTMGARPIASLNSLRFGPIRDGEAPAEEVQRNRYLFERVVAGIGGYGNCVGVPTVGGEVSFHRRYSGNPLVNAMCVGIVRLDEVATAAAAGIGNPVLYLGSSTGKDGIHGATFASDALGEDNEEKRPNVQIGDPFAEKELIEATLEALETGAIVAIQDMGAAGLTCSTVEMSSKGNVGMEIELARVPTREAGMSAYEMMLSESQERMLAVASKGREEEVLSIFRKWGQKAEIIGTVTADGLTTIRHHGEIVARVDPHLLTDRCPTYATEPEVPDYWRRAQAFDPAILQHPEPNASLLKLLASPNIASKRWVYRQYDQQVQTQTIRLPGASDAAVLAPRGTKKGIALSIDGNGRHVYLHPRIGGRLAVAEAARNVACAGAKPVAVTDGLNYGNPQRGHVYWQFAESVRGIAEACEAFETPVVSGNVSFYNESDLGEVLPTPLIGMLGILEGANKSLGLAPDGPTEAIGLVFVPLETLEQEGLGASEYLAEVLGIENGVPESPNLEGERRLQEFLWRANENAWITLAHDASEGGIAVTASEIALACGAGLKLRLDVRNALCDAEIGSASLASALFGELPGRVLVGVRTGAEPAIADLASTLQLGWSVCGTLETNETDLSIVLNGSEAVRVPMCELRNAYEESLGTLMEHNLQQ